MQWPEVISSDLKMGGTGLYMYSVIRRQHVHLSMFKVKYIQFKEQRKTADRQWSLVVAYYLQSRTDQDNMRVIVASNWIIQVQVFQNSI